MIGLLIPYAFGQLTFSHILGTEGNGTLQFKKPAGIAVDNKEGKIYVAEFENKRIQVLDFSGNFDSFIYLEGNAHGVEIEGNRIYVAIWSDESHVDIFNKNGTRLSSISGFESPGDIAINNSGKIFVTDYGTGEIKIFNPYGDLLKTLTIPPTSNNIDAKPTGIALDVFGDIYVADYLNDRVMKMNSSGNFLFELIVPDVEGGKFSKPTNLEINSKGDIFVTDRHRVLVFNSNGDFLYTFGELGKDAAQFSGPHGIAFDNSGNIYVAEYDNHRIQVFNTLDSSQIHQNITEQKEIREVDVSKSISWFDSIINYIKSIFNW